MWCSSAVNRTPFCASAACRTRPSAACTLARPCVRSALACGVFRSANRLPSSPSAARCRALFETFSGTTRLSDFPGSSISGVRPQTSRCAPPPCLSGSWRRHGISRIACEVFPCMHRVSDPVGSPPISRCRWAGYGLPHEGTASAPHSRYFRGSIPGLHVPLLTLRHPPYGWPRIARGRHGSLLLCRTTLAFATPRRLSRRNPSTPLSPGLGTCLLCTSQRELRPLRTSSGLFGAADISRGLIGPKPQDLVAAGLEL